MQISNMFAENQIYGVAPNKCRKQNVAEQARYSSFDRVTISDAAREAYQNSKQSVKAEPMSSSAFTKAGLSKEDKELEATLTDFFNKTHSNAGTIIGGDVVIDLGQGALLPENKELRGKIKAQIEQLLAENPTPAFTVASPELLEKLEPLRQKNDVISALGDKIVVTDELLEKGSSFLLQKEMQWRNDNGWDNSLQSRFQSAIKGSGDTPSNRMSEEERLRKIEEEAKKKMGVSS